MNRLYRFFTDKKYRLICFSEMGFMNWIPDSIYLKIMYKTILGRELNLENPQSFNEKLQWLKLYDRNNDYSCMVDKLEAKEYVSQIIGKEYIIPTLGVWNKFDDIDFNSLPSSFVLKCTHDSGGLVVVRDKSKLDIKAAKKKIKKSIRNNYYWNNREWPYKNVRPRIIAEEYMEDDNSKELTDYKFFCFNGEPKFLYVSSGLENHSTARISFLNLDWQFANFKRADYKGYEVLPQQPTQLNRMIELSRQLSKNIPFLRVDLYEINNKIYFSELTFSPCGGFLPFEDEKSDYEIGQMLQI